MPEYTVKAVFGPQEWQSQQGGPMHNYSLDLEGVDKRAEINQKPQTPAPQVGQKLNLILEPHPRFPERLKARKEQPVGGFQGAGGSGRRSSDPAERKSIEAQVAAKVAGSVAVELAKAGKLELAGSSEFKRALSALTDTVFEAIHSKGSQ